MKEIPLTRGYVAIVDDENFDLISSYRWNASEVFPGKVYASRSRRLGETGSSMIYMHRFILNPPSGMIVDHINRNTLDNRLENLRQCGFSINSINSAISKKNKSGYRGVCWDKERRKWVAQGRRNGVVVRIGAFKCPIEAAIAKDRFSIEQYGEAAVLNFPTYAHDLGKAVVGLNESNETSRAVY